MSPRAGIPAAIITVSDEVASGSDEDRAGALAAELLASTGILVTRSVVPDDPDLIAAAIEGAVDRGSRFVLTCGGTGIGPRDHTSDVVARMVSFEIPGIGEEIRRRGIAHTPAALMSREVAGVVLRAAGDPVLVVCAPGSRGGVRDAWGVVGPVLDDILDQLDGAGHR